mgnify:CR=1 FL=1
MTDKVLLTGVSGWICLLYTSDAADDSLRVDLGGRRIIKKVKRLKSKPHPIVVKKLGMACSYPGTFNSSIHSIINATKYKRSILRKIKAVSCNCSIVNFIGAYFAALKGVNSIPKSWIKKTDPAKKILNQK